MKTAADLRAEAERAEADAAEATQRAFNLREDAKRVALAERRAAEAKAHNEHNDKMYDEIGQPIAGLSRAQHEIVYSAAWSHGHSSGFDEVANYYGEFADFARNVLDAK